MLPSEHQLSDEFQIARPTAVRALRVLRQDGWIDTQQGKGSFVRGRPALAGLEVVRPGEEALNRDESGDLIGAAASIPPARVSALLGQADGTDALSRRLLVRRDGEASEIVTWWVPSGLAEGTDLSGDKPVAGGVRAHLARRKGVRVDHVAEQVVARHPTSQEAKLLGVGKSAAMLVLYVTGRDASGAAVLVLELVMPGDRHELEDVYQVG
jgi:GntR family transcriptional regulator